MSIPKRVSFFVLLFAISFFGFLLRVIDYDRIPPFGETQDEFFYPWSGMTLITKGIPTAWSWFDSYPQKEYVVYWGRTYPLVTPWVEKPPLYSLIQGTTVLLFGDTNLNDVRLSQIRTIPLALSFFTIFLVGLLARELFNKNVGILAAVLYATIPSFVLANRFSLVENLMTPLILAASYLFLKKANIFLITVFCALAILTKNIGFILPLVIMAILFFDKKWRDLAIIGAISGVAFLVHPAMGAYYDWNLFVNVLKDYQKAHALIGLPGLAQAILASPTVSAKEVLFPDGSVLAGYVLLFSSPFWLINDHIKSGKLGRNLLLGIPIGYLIVLSLLESGGTQFSFFGWHVYPIFPYLAILLARILVDIYYHPSLYKLLIMLFIIGASSIRFLLTLLPTFHDKWQYIAISLIILASTGLIPKNKSQKPILLAFILIYLLINILVVLNMGKFYRSFAQPIS